MLHGWQLAVQPLSFACMQDAGLLRVVAAPVAYLFLSIMHREVLMDINDTRGDQEAGVRTLPVVFGRKAALGMAAGLCNAALGVAMHAAVAGSGLQWLVREPPFEWGFTVPDIAPLAMRAIERGVVPAVCGSRILATPHQSVAVWRVHHDAAAAAHSDDWDPAQQLPEGGCEGCSRRLHEGHRVGSAPDSNFGLK